MLVLSRRPSETILFPQLGISVSIVSVKGSRVQVGVEAPSEIQVLRKELESTAETIPDERNMRRSFQEKHDFRNRLNQATLGLHLAQKQLAAGQANAADASLASALTRLIELEEEVTARGTNNSVAAPTATASTNGSSAGSSSSSSEHATRITSKRDSSSRIDVLLVEDDQNEQALLRTLLEMEGYRVYTASNGNEALQCLEQITPQCVLLDMMMPECDGPETLERMRAMPNFGDLPIFAVSGTSPESVGLSIGTDGVSDWFPKPLNAPRLVKHMRERIACLCS
jgi:two-component system, OmpR family, response regulator